MDLGRMIAGMALDKGAFKLRPDDPFKWASGYKMPVYNDNTLLGYSSARALISAGMFNIMKDESMKPDFIAGVLTSGVPPATSLAQLKGIPLAMARDDEVLLFSNELIDALSPKSDLFDKVDAIFGVAPYSIPFAVNLADKLSLPFCYVRPEAKDHGMGNRIEGKFQKGWKIHLMDNWLDTGYLNDTVNYLESEGLKVTSMKSRMLPLECLHDTLEGKTVLPVENVVSFGGSSLAEIRHFRQHYGAKIGDLLTAYTYGFQEMYERLWGNNIGLHAVYDFDNILSEAKVRGDIDYDQLKTLLQWRKDPKGNR